MSLYIKRLEHRRKEKTELLRSEFKKEALYISQLLSKAGFKFDRIYLFGSVVEKDKPLFPWSDIDLAIEGLPSDMFYKTYGFLLKNSKHEIDLKPFEELNEAVRKKIRRKGKVIYEKKE